MTERRTPRAKLPKDELIDMYVNQKKSLTEISNHYGVCPATISNHLDRHGIERRTAGDTLRTELGGTRCGDWLVTHETSCGTGDVSHLRWKCICTRCDNASWVLARSLYTGTSTMCKPCRKKSMFKGYQEISMTYWRSIMGAAASRDLAFEVSIEFAWELFLAQHRKCALSGLEIVFAYKGDGTASLDRVDSKLGYTECNVQWVHKDINRMKWAYPEDYFITLCKQVAAYNSGENAPAKSGADCEVSCQPA